MPESIEPSWRDSLVLIAESQVGVRELTGKNDGKEVEAYLLTCRLKKGNPWCVAFLNWCFLEIGDTLPILHPAYSPEWFRDPVPVVYRKSWQKVDFISLPAQVAGFYIPSKGRIGHGGLICWEDQNNYYLIEGNTNVAGSDEGDGVYRKIRDKDDVYVISDPILLFNQN